MSEPNKPADTAQAPFIIGIDLGTTHTVVSFIDTRQSHATPTLFEIEQLVAPGEIAPRSVLPSFRYHPTKDELPASAVQLPWHAEPVDGEDSNPIIGSLARELGAKVAGRLVSSAKSWLSHNQVDRGAPILPWDGDKQVAPVSPVVASASYLQYVRQAWNYAQPDYPMEQQDIVITVPASFDESARAHTVAAAQLAKLTNFVLLEEPQAVVYDWYYRNLERGNELLEQVHLLLVCDVGGGTTDLSLIRVSQDQGNLELTRVGVGDHLMLGGDNIDLTLAHQAEAKLSSGGGRLTSSRLAQLLQQTRIAKETLLKEGAPETATVTLVGAGAKLIGGAKSCTLDRDSVRQTVMEGFMPLSDIAEQPSRRKSAIMEFGLPYVSDPAISKHVASFLQQHQQAAATALGEDKDSGQAPFLPDGLLLNGGLFKSPILAQRAEGLVNHWRDGKNPVVVLENPHADLAVSFGASVYGLARRQQSLRIKGGSARSFFLLLDDSKDQKRGICVMPKGTEENQIVQLRDQQFELIVGQPVKFHLATTTADTEYQAGELQTLNEEFITLPPLLAVMDRRQEGLDRVSVSLQAVLTEVGTIELACVPRELIEEDADGDRSASNRWLLEFEIRRDTPKIRTNTADLPPKTGEAIAAIDEVFGAKRKEFNPKAAKTLKNDLVKLLGKREDWSFALSRELFNALLERKKNRTRSEVHERLWFNLAGFGIRPGFGDPLDSWRVEQVWPLYQQGLKFSQGNQNWAEWWNFWRRIAGGLNAEQQHRIFKDIGKFINPSVVRNRKLATELKQRSYEDMLRLVASLEHLKIANKTEVGAWLLKRLEKKSESPTAWWALGRIATRTPFHGSLHNLVPVQAVEKWLATMLAENWKQNQNASFAAVMLGRKTGDRARDLDPALQEKIVDKLQTAKAPASWIELIEQVKEMDEVETRRVFGEALPVGLKLVQDG